MARLKKCKAPGCRFKFEAVRPFQVVCSPACAARYQSEQKYKKWKKEAREYRRNLQASRKSGRPVGAKATAVKYFNEFIRVRDHNKPCIVHLYDCKERAFDAGHFKSVGSHPELEFVTWNVHKQCAVNNRGSHKRSRYLGEGTQALYRRNLVDRIGEDRVAWLEGPHNIKQYRDEDYRRIARIFRRRAEHYKKLRGL